MMEQALDRGDQALIEGRQSVQDLREDATAGGDLSGALGHCGEVLTQDHHIQFSISCDRHTTALRSGTLQRGV